VAAKQEYIFSIAQQLNASLYVAEHRYFGASKPKDGPYSSPTDVANIGIDLVLEDFKALIKSLRKDGQNLILSGAGYAGEIATVLRLKDSDKAIFGYVF
jgi:hypothetical protein